MKFRRFTVGLLFGALAFSSVSPANAGVEQIFSGVVEVWQPFYDLEFRRYEIGGCAEPEIDEFTSIILDVREHRNKQIEIRFDGGLGIEDELLVVRYAECEFGSFVGINEVGPTYKFTATVESYIQILSKAGMYNSAVSVYTL